MPPKDALILSRRSLWGYAYLFGLMVLGVIGAVLYIRAGGGFLATLDGTWSGERSTFRMLVIFVVGAGLIVSMIHPLYELARGRNAAIWIVDGRLFWKGDGPTAIALKDITEVRAHDDYVFRVVLRTRTVREIPVGLEDGEALAAAIRAAAGLPAAAN